MAARYYRMIITIGVILSSVHIVCGQKLPNVQPSSLLASANAKVDGKNTEWGDKFQAYNHATQIYYTIANDNENIYLVVQSTDHEVIQRIMGKGLTFRISATDEKNGKSLSVTYPILNRLPNFKLSNRKGEFPDTTFKTVDSIMRRNNRLMSDSSKYINVKGAAGLDTLISVYNDEGIKAVGMFDKNRYYTYELAISLKYLPIKPGEKKIKYQIIVNGAKPMPLLTVPKQNSPEAYEAAQRSTDLANAHNAMRSQPTDFWGEYTLAKKP